MSRWNLCFFCLVLLCHCAVKHQPAEFSSYFYFETKKDFSLESLREKMVLQKKGELSVLERTRLLELLNLELKTLDSGSPLFEKIREEAALLKTELEGVQHEEDELLLSSSAKVSRRERKTGHKKEIRNAQLRQLYQEAYQHWNLDQNEVAYEKVNAILNNPQYLDPASDSEQIKMIYLKFRIALDLVLFDAAEESYLWLRDLDKCAAETSTAAFLVSLIYFTKGNLEAAMEAFEDECETGSSPSASLRRAYWRARFDELRVPARTGVYDFILRTPIPDYYVFLSAIRTKKNLTFPPVMFNGRSFLSGEFSVSKKVRFLLVSAEQRLDAGLRKDAEQYLLAASRILRDDPSGSDIKPLLYIAHLLKAAGSHLEAMKIYSVVTDFVQDRAESKWIVFDFISEMYPLPHADEVDPLSSLWGIDPDLVYSLMRQESAFNPEARSHSGARGLLQLMPFLARSLAEQWGEGAFYSDELLFHGKENLKWAIFHLHQLYTYAPHPVFISASYNAGLTRVDRWWKRFGMFPVDVFVEFIPVAETRNYVKLVLRNLLYYKALRSGGTIRWDLIPFELPPYPVKATTPKASVHYQFSGR